MEHIENKILVVCSDFNQTISSALLQGALRAFEDAQFSVEQIVVVHCAGAYDIPVLLQQGLNQKNMIGGLALGCVIQGGTRHFDYVANECARGVMDVMLKTGKPIGFGVLTTWDESQALARAGENDDDNKGYQSAMALIESLSALAAVTA